MPQYFGIATVHPNEFEVLPGASHKIEFAVTNNQTSFRNLGFRATPLKPGGEEDPTRPEASWLRVEPPPNPLVASGAEVRCAVEVTVPSTVAPGTRIEFVLVVYDSDLSGADEVKNSSAPFALTVAGELPEPVVPEPPKDKRPPWWVFMPGAGIGLLWLILVAISQSDGDREALLLLPVILTVVGALGLTISSAILGRKKAPVDDSTYNYGWVAATISGVFLLFAIGCAIAAAASEANANHTTAPGLIVLVIVLVVVVAVPLPLSILVIKRQSTVPPPP